MSTNRSEHAYLELLSRQYPTVEAVCSEIIQLGATLSLPKGTEHFMSDLHGEEGPSGISSTTARESSGKKVDAAFRAHGAGTGARLVRRHDLLSRGKKSRRSKNPART